MGLNKHATTTKKDGDPKLATRNSYRDPHIRITLNTVMGTLQTAMRLAKEAR